MKPHRTWDGRIVPSGIADRPRPKRPRWSRWWVAMFATFAVTLLVAVPFVGFWHWWSLAAVFFGVPEFVGARVQNDRFPPLTHIIVEYVHPEVALPLLYGFSAGIGAFWFGFPHPGAMGLLFGLMGWFIPHFLLRYIERLLAERRED